MLFTHKWHCVSHAFVDVNKSEDPSISEYTLFRAKTGKRGFPINGKLLDFRPLSLIENL